MPDENPTLESLNNELQELKTKFENRNVFQEIANQLTDLIEIKTSIEPTVGSMVNEGEEFILKVTVDFKLDYNKPLNIVYWSLGELTNSFSIYLGYWSNCIQKKDNSGEKIIFIKTYDVIGGVTPVADYRLSHVLHTDTGLNMFVIYELSILEWPLVVEYHLVAAENINREQLLAEVEYQCNNVILMMRRLSKKVEIGNEVIHPG